MCKEELEAEIISNGIHYTLRGDFYFPDIIIPEADPRPIGKWGRMHKRYLQEHRPILFNQLVLHGNLSTYLADLNDQAQERLELLVQQMQRIEGIDEPLKARNQLEWIGRMNNIRQRAEESIMAEIVLF